MEYDEGWIMSDVDSYSDQCLLLPDSMKIHIPVRFILYHDKSYVDDALRIRYLDQIEKSMKILNETFDHKLIFVEVPEYNFIPSTKTDLNEWMEESREWMEEWEEEGSAIYVFVTATNTDLNGFTPVFSKRHDYYAKYTPRFDGIYLSYRSLLKGSTLAHEVGHFFSLEHTWEAVANKTHVRLGLSGEEARCVNTMSYNCHRTGFTDEQIDKCISFLLKYRPYLIN